MFTSLIDLSVYFQDLHLFTNKVIVQHTHTHTHTGVCTSCSVLYDIVVGLYLALSHSVLQTRCEFLCACFTLCKKQWYCCRCPKGV